MSLESMLSILKENSKRSILINMEMKFIPSITLMKMDTLKPQRKSKLMNTEQLQLVNLNLMQFLQILLLQSLLRKDVNYQDSFSSIKYQETSILVVIITLMLFKDCICKATKWISLTRSTTWVLVSFRMSSILRQTTMRSSSMSLMEEIPSKASSCKIKVAICSVDQMP